MRVSFGVRVAVEVADIDVGRPNHCGECPAAVATRRSLQRCGICLLATDIVRVFLEATWVVFKNRRYETSRDGETTVSYVDNVFVAQNPPALQEFIERFDVGEYPGALDYYVEFHRSNEPVPLCFGDPDIQDHNGFSKWVGFEVGNSYDTVARDGFYYSAGFYHLKRKEDL